MLQCSALLNNGGATPPKPRRGGLVGPWTAVTPLMALCTDPHDDIRGRALRLLRQLCDK